MVCCVLAVCGRVQASAPVLVSAKPLAMIYLALRPQQAVDVLLPADRDMHEYKLTVADISRVQQAPLLFWLGPVSEPFLQVLEQRFSAQRKWVALAGNTGHAWLDQQQIAALSGAMAKALVQQYPAEKTAIEARQAAFVASINQRYRFWQQQLQPYSTKPFLLGHDAYQLFAANVGLRQGVIYRAANDHGHVQAGMHELLAIQQRIASGDITCALEEPEVSFSSLARRYTALHIARLDPLGMAIPLTEQSYLAFIDAGAAAFLACLQGK
jgi:zinc transport system substrate-binding protein